jgi:hypothetical protein
MVRNNIAGYPKKQLTGAVLFTGYCVGNIIGPQTFIASEARTSISLLVVLHRGND